MKIYRRDNKKSTSYYALALKDFELRSRVLGSYRLERDKWYRLQIGRAGRNSSVYKESLWTALNFMLEYPDHTPPNSFIL